ncbi:signal peptidase I [Nonomuraea solani]|uniref:signal peptidase I n=1 Tax=Nonomuraea solani TaxID=1144553 RepID=A0A1H5W4I7_9ACTN|nr:S26 family signal peptidase [Nonomuraea solani]SEF94419.1 signal peptidase I [Nonomuraea solani]
MLVVIVALALSGGACLLWVRGRHLLVTVDGPSMEPAYAPGDRVLVRRVPFARVRRGQVVLVRRDPAQGTELVIKRAVAVPGDPVPRIGFPTLAETAVPAGKLLVVGDNRARSYDSRHHGYVPAERFVGVVVRSLPGR